MRWNIKFIVPHKAVQKFDPLVQTAWSDPFNGVRAGSTSSSVGQRFIFLKPDRWSNGWWVSHRTSQPNRQPDTSKIHVKLREISVTFPLSVGYLHVSLLLSLCSHLFLFSILHVSLSLRFPSLLSLVSAISILNRDDTTITSLKALFETQNLFISLMWGVRMHKGTTGKDSSTITLCFAFYVFRVLVLGVFHVRFVTCPTQNFLGSWNRISKPTDRNLLTRVQTICERIRSESVRQISTPTGFGQKTDYGQIRPARPVNSPRHGHQ